MVTDVAAAFVAVASFIAMPSPLCFNASPFCLRPASRIVNDVVGRAACSDWCADEFAATHCPWCLCRACSFCAPNGLPAAVALTLRAATPTANPLAGGDAPSMAMARGAAAAIALLGAAALAAAVRRWVGRRVGRPVAPATDAAGARENKAARPPPARRPGKPATRAPPRRAAAAAGSPRRVNKGATRPATSKARFSRLNSECPEV